MDKKEIVAIIDHGCRGAVLAQSYANHPSVSKIIAIPGNDMMQSISSKPLVCFTTIKESDVSEIVKICLAEKITLAEVCQDDAVEAGVVNALRDAKIPVIGHTQEAGIIEWDKAWCRQFLERIGLSSYRPKFHIFTNLTDGTTFLKNQPNQAWFIKASGLAAGKGALPAKNTREAIRNIKELKKRFPQAAKRYLIEEWVKNDDGTPAEEFSYYAFCKGKQWKYEGNYQDHKRALDFDEGENTGGMGSVSPTSVITPEVEKQIKIILDTVVPAMADETDSRGKNRELSGDLYLGGILMRKKGRVEVKILEFNARLGDPEAHTLLGVKTNRLVIAKAITEKKNLEKLKITFESSVRVILTAAVKGYPGDYKEVLGKEIFGIPEILKNKKVRFYGAGIKKVGERYFVNGGRLFYLVGRGRTILEARKKVYEAMTQVYIEGNALHYRKDIGHLEVEKYWKHSGRDEA